MLKQQTERFWADIVWGDDGDDDDDGDGDDHDINHDDDDHHHNGDELKQQTEEFGPIYIVGGS